MAVEEVLGLEWSSGATLVVTLEDMGGRCAVAIDDG